MRTAFDGRRIAGYLVLGAAGVAGVLAVWAFFTGGFRVHIFGIPISARGEHRAALVAAICAACGYLLLDRDRQLTNRAVRVTASVLRSLPGPVRTLASALARRSSAMPALTACAAAAVVLIAGLAMGSRAAGGADPYGYVSQADLWRTGDLRIHQPFVAAMPWPDAEWTFSPLGYKPSADHTIIPTYAPGYPLLMALFTLVFGTPAAFWVAPLAGAALVLLTYALGARLSGPIVGMIAALSIACSPTVLFLTLSVMSDVPVAAFWAAAVLLAARRTDAAALASAVAAGIAIVIRPNLVFAAVIPLLVVSWPRPNRSLGEAFRRAAVFAIACAPFAVFVGWLFNDLYGSPLRSGYGENDALFGLKNISANLRTYPPWLLETQGPLAFLFLVSPLVALWRGDRSSLRWFYAAFAAAIIVSYFVYLPFDAWWYLRFLLPAFPFMFVLSADAMWLAASPLAPRTRSIAMALFAIVACGFGAMNSDSRDVLAIGHGEEKYIEVGRYLDRTIPRNAVVYSMQHCGSIRYYSGRLTLRYDYLPPDWLDRSIVHMQQQGYEPFFLLDEWEVPMVRERFASQSHAAVLFEEPRPGPCTHTTFLYRIAPRPGELRAVRVPAIAGCE